MYTSVFRLVLASLLHLLAPYLHLVLIVAVLLAMFSQTPVLESVLGTSGRGLRNFFGMVVRAAFGALCAFFPWSVRTGRRWALGILRGRAGRTPRRWQVDLLGLLFIVLIWAATYVVVFYPWIPITWVSTAPASSSPAAPTVPLAALPGSGGPSPASAPERLAKHLSDTLDRAIKDGNGGIEINIRGWNDADVAAAIDLLGDPTKAAAAGLPQRDVSRSDRLNSFLRVTPPGGTGGRLVQDFP